MRTLVPLLFLFAFAAAGCTASVEEVRQPSPSPAPAASSGEAPPGGSETTPPAPGTPSAHALTVTYRGMRTDPYRNNKTMFVRVRGESSYAKTQSVLVKDGKGSVAFTDVPQGLVQIDAYIDVDASRSCGVDDFSASFKSNEPLMKDDELSFSVVSNGCEIEEKF